MKLVKGDLVVAFQTNVVNVLIHQANCFNTMGAGIALQIKKELPDAYKADCATIKGLRAKLGKYSYAVIGRGMVFNLYGQYSLGRTKQHTDYEAQRKALRAIADKLRHRAVDCRIGISKLGCGLAGGDWEVVSMIIAEELAGFDVTIYQK